MDNTQPIIDLTNSFPRINWPHTDSIIELLDDSIGNDYTVDRRDNRSFETRFNEGNIASLNIDSHRTAPPTRKRKAPRSRIKQNTRASELTTEDHYNRDRSRSPISFGDCPICCEELGKNPLASTKCGHVYCVKCLEQSLRSNKRCPTCRVVLKGRTAYHPLYISKNKN